MKGSPVRVRASASPVARAISHRTSRRRQRRVGACRRRSGGRACACRPARRGLRRAVRLPADEAPALVRPSARRLRGAARSRGAAGQTPPRRTLRGGTGWSPQHRRAAPRPAACDPAGCPLRHHAGSRLPGRQQQRGGCGRGDRDREGAEERPDGGRARSPSASSSPTARRRLPVSPTSTLRVSAAARPTPPRTHASFAR